MELVLALVTIWSLDRPVPQAGPRRGARPKIRCPLPPGGPRAGGPVRNGPAVETRCRRPGEGLLATCVGNWAPGPLWTEQELPPTVVVAAVPNVQVPWFVIVVADPLPMGSGPSGIRVPVFGRRPFEEQSRCRSPPRTGGERPVVLERPAHDGPAGRGCARAARCPREAAPPDETVSSLTANELVGTTNGRAGADTRVVVAPPEVGTPALQLSCGIPVGRPGDARPVRVARQGGRAGALSEDGEAAPNAVRLPPRRRGWPSRPRGRGITRRTDRWSREGRRARQVTTVALCGFALVGTQVANRPLSPDSGIMAGESHGAPEAKSEFPPRILWQGPGFQVRRHVSGVLPTTGLAGGCPPRDFSNRTAPDA